MNELERRGLLGAAGLVGIAALSRAAKAGPLDPPPGPVAPTGRTLDEIYNRIPGTNGSGDGRIAIPGGTAAVVLSNPGSYVLTGNLSVAGSNALTINASNVTLDLNGFTISGGTSTGISAIEITDSRSNVRVRNGLVVGGNAGVRVGICTYIILEDLQVSGSRAIGIACPRNAGAKDFTIRRCFVTGIGSSSVASDSFATVFGIDAQVSSATLIDNVVTRLQYNGTGAPTFYGIYAYGPTTDAMVVARNTVALVWSGPPYSGAGISVGAGIYRDNNVNGYVTKYQTISGTVNGGGNF